MLLHKMSVKRPVERILQKKWNHYINLTIIDKFQYCKSQNRFPLNKGNNQLHLPHLPLPAFLL